MFEITTHSADETQKIGEIFAALLRAGNTVCLNGELGSGKTVFVRGAVKGLGFDDHVTSPTFALVHEYQAASTIYHIDCFRLFTTQDFMSLGIEDYLAAEGVIFAEWGDRIADMFNDWLWKINFNFVDGGENDRRIVFSLGRRSHSRGYYERLKTLIAGSTEVNA